MISSSNFREKWAYELFSSIDKKYEKEVGMNVYAESLSLWFLDGPEAIEAKRDYLRRRYAHPPRLIIFIADLGWYACRPLLDTIWKDVPTIVCHSQPHSAKDINRRYTGAHIAEDQAVSIPAVRDRYKTTLLYAPVYVEENLRLVKEMQPQIKQLVVLLNDRYTSYIVEKRFEEVARKMFPSLSLKFITSGSTDTEQLLEQLSSFGSETGIIYGSWINRS
ncbi:MAG: PAS domain-containing sensor histidine kinase, partial [Prevotellaceae bacterium]|nr:PAS domain-containing sensor histidine kinase [Prevotellaceae bacterium]